MKKLLLFLLFVTAFQIATAQRIPHHSYTVTYHPGLKTCDSVSWDLTPEMRNCPDPKPRKDAFAIDPFLGNVSPKPTDYGVNKGATNDQQIDKGHLFNAKDAACDGGFYNECYYMTNMLPQYHSFNTGDWKKLEIREQKLATTQTLHIIAGRIGSLGQLPAGEDIPAFMYKAIYKNGGWKVWIMKNSPDSKGHDIDRMWLSDIATLDRLTGLRL